MSRAPFNLTIFLKILISQFSEIFSMKPRFQTTLSKFLIAN